MIEKPLVTIITVVFNLKKSGREKYFRQCLKSVRGQSYRNIEHIVIDGASMDGTVDLIREYSDKGWIKYISEPDTGIYNAMNKGIKMAQGKYIAFLNSDDYYCNNDAIGLSVEALEKYDADFSYADFCMVNKYDKQLVRACIEKFIFTMPFGHPTMFTKTSVIRQENGFDEKRGLPADYDLIIRLILKDYKGVYVNEKIVDYRIGGLGSTTDHSDKIAEIYYNNYSIFHNFSNIEQAKKIMYELKLPYSFISNFKNYVKNHKNINVNKVVGNLIDNLDEYKEKNDIDELNCKKDGIPVFLSSDNKYSPFVATTICSIMDNTDSFINFYILDGGIVDKNVQKIKDIKKIFPNFSVEFLEINIDKEFSNFPTRLHFSVAMYTRFLIPRLKPNLKKIIYSDVDVIFNGDIKELWEENLDGYIIGAVPYIFGYINPNKKEIKSYHKRLNLSSNHKYFESGLLLIDIDKWIKNNITEKLIREVKNNASNKILTPDQDVFNIIFDDDYKKLDNKYIVVPHRKKIMQTDIVTKKSIEDPFIIHYAGSDKPWKNPKMDMSNYFWKYARMTSFYEGLICDLASYPQVKNNSNSKMSIILKFKNKIIDGLVFAVFSPKEFIKKYLNKFLNSRLRQPARKIWYFIRGKKAIK